MELKETIVTIVAFVLISLVVSQMISCQRMTIETRAKCLMNANAIEQVLKCKEI